MQLWSSSIGDVNFPGLSPQAIDNMPIGQVTPARGTFTDLQAQAVIGAQVYNTDAQTATIVLTGADISGASVEVDLGLTGAIATAQNVQLPTVAALLAALPAEVIGQTYKLRILFLGGSASGALTVTTNTGWTLAGTMTIAVGAYRDFLVKLTGANGVVTGATLQNIGGGTI